MLQSRRCSSFVADPSKTQARHESPQCHVGAFVVWNLPIGLQRSRSQLEFEVNLRPKFRGNPGFREIPVWRCAWLINWLHAVTRLPDANSHSCRMLCTNAPWDTMPHLSWLACDPARCVNWAARGPVSSGRWVCSMACGNDADRVRFFWPPTISVATRTLTSGASRNGRRARDAGRSCTWLPKLEPTLVGKLSLGRPSLR